MTKKLQYYVDSGLYNADQIMEIKRGLKDGVDVTKYADPKYTRQHMFLIRGGLKRGLDVTIYADPKYTPQQMSQIRKSLLKEKK